MSSLSALFGLTSVMYACWNIFAIFASGVLPARRNHYSMLGVSRSAGSDEIKKAFNKLAMKWHPDKNPSEVTKAEVVFMGIKDAYECLIDPIKRRRYDRNGA